MRHFYSLWQAGGKVIQSLLGVIDFIASDSVSQIFAEREKAATQFMLKTSE